MLAPRGSKRPPAAVGAASGLICIRLTSRKQISIPPCFTAHCGLFVRYRVTQRGNVVTRYNARYTCIVPRSQVGRALDGPLGATRAGLTVTGLARACRFTVVQPLC
nr:hypothetical protein [uncultured bacterium]